MGLKMPKEVYMCGGGGPATLHSSKFFRAVSGSRNPELGGGGKTRDKAMNSNFPTLAGDLHLSLG